jgi:hypothetical protein
MLAYESVLADPDKTLSEVFGWLGEGDVEAAVAHVEPTLRTQRVGSEDDTDIEAVEIEDSVIKVFDELYEAVREKQPLQQSFVDRLNEINQQLSDRIAEAMRESARGQQERRKYLAALRRRTPAPELR